MLHFQQQQKAYKRTEKNNPFRHSRKQNYWVCPDMKPKDIKITFLNRCRNLEKKMWTKNKENAYKQNEKFRQYNLWKGRKNYRGER